MMKVLFVLSGNGSTGLDPLINNQGMSIEAIQNIKIDYYEIKGRGIKGYLSNVLPLRKITKRNGYDIIHAHYSLSAFVASLAGCKPLVVSLMGSDVKANAYYRFIIHLFSFFFKWSLILVKSEDMYRSLGITKAIVIPNGIDMNKYNMLDKKECQFRLNWDSDKKHILFPANPNRKEKNYKLLERSVVGLNDIVVHYFQNTPNNLTPIWYNAADIVVLTSFWEGSPNAIKEAMACNRPIVSTDVGDVAWLFGSTEGCFLTTFEMDDCAETIDKALLFSEQNKYTAGRKRLSDIGLEDRVIANKIIQLYKKQK